VNVNEARWVVGDRVWNPDTLNFERFHRRLGTNIIVIIVVIIVLVIGIFSIIG